MDKGISSFLNLSRWLAAFLVLICHVRHIVLVDFKNVVNKDVLAKGFYFLTGFGDEAVVIFFVVSGLLVGGLTLEKWQTRRAASLADYFIHRVSRIYIVLIPAILIGVSFDYIGMINFDAAQLYSNSPQYYTVSMNSIIKDHVGANIVFGNLAMLQNISVHVLGSNGPLWSLAYEWWYYCIWGALIAVIYYKGLVRWFCIFLLLGMIAILPNDLLRSMSVWLLGVVVFYYGKSNLPKPHPIFGISVFLIGLFASRISHNINNLLEPEPWYIGFYRDFGLGLAYSIALVSCYKLDRPLWFENTHVKLASFSYSLYLVHFPMLVLMIAAANQNYGISFLQQPTLESFEYFTVLVFVLCLYAYLFSLTTEKHTYKVVGILRTRLLNKQIP